MIIELQGLSANLTSDEIELKDTLIKKLQILEQALLEAGPNDCKRVNILIRTFEDAPQVPTDFLAISVYPNEVKSKKLLNIRIQLSIDLQTYVRKSTLVNKIECFILYDTAIDAITIKEDSNEGVISQNPSLPSKNDDEKFEFFVTRPKYSLDQMVLNESLEKEIKVALMTISNQKRIYEEWGFEEIDNIPKAILNFFGPPGTGKTMAAHAIASYNNSSILALNYSEIESKYVGDAPKKLVQAFEAASKEKAVLFFDEADSFLGKRIADVSSSSDQAINSLRSQLLILLENFEGIVIFATNLVGNYDKAFESRILKHLKFDLPDSRLRKSIILKMIPVKAPIENGSLTDAQLDELVEISEGLAGRQIKNAILETLTYAAFNNEEVISFKYFKEAFEKLKSNLDFLKSESGPTISFEVKEQLEKRIQMNLDAEK